MADDGAPETERRPASASGKLRFGDRASGSPPSAVMQAALTASELARARSKREADLAEDLGGKALGLAGKNQ
jgi:hypothetical protein